MTDDELTDIVTLMTLLVTRNPRRRHRMNGSNVDTDLLAGSALSGSL